MSLCPSCGKELSAKESSAKFCTYCGAPLSTETTETNNQTIYSEATPNIENTVAAETPVNEAVSLIDQIFEKAKTVPVLNSLLEKVNKKFYPLILALPIVLILVIVIAVSSSDSYMEPMNDYFKLINKKSTDYMNITTSLSPDFRAKLKKNMYNSDIESIEDMIKDATDELEDEYDALDDEFNKWKIGFEVKEAEKLSKKKVEKFQDTLEDYFDDYIKSSIDEYEDILDDDDDLEDFADNLDISEKEAKSYIKKMIKYLESYEDVKVSEAYEIKGKFTIKADKDNWKSDTVRVLAVKINGDWAYAGLDDGNYISFEDDDEEISLFDSFFSPLKRNYAKY